MENYCNDHSLLSLLIKYGNQTGIGPVQNILKHLEITVLNSVTYTYIGFFNNLSKKYRQMLSIFCFEKLFKKLNEDFGFGHLDIQHILIGLVGAIRNHLVFKIK